MSSYVVVFVTVSSAGEARKIAEALVRERLAACVNEVPGVRSIYRWKGKVESAGERLLLIKTARRRLPALTKRVRALHSYTVPEVIALPILSGNADYLSWIADAVSTAGKRGPS
jgi:periplasmic divalent cation tolerance protein